MADDVLSRWRSDRQHFPTHAYEARNLVWKGSDPLLWRTFSSAERLGICGFPVTALDEILGSDRGPVEARINTLVGQGFHLPFTIVLFFNHGAGGPWCLASPANRSQLWPRRTFLALTHVWDSFQPDAFIPSLD